jgi:hypothetical protein
MEINPACPSEAKIPNANKAVPIVSKVTTVPKNLFLNPSFASISSFASYLTYFSTGFSAGT